MFRFAVFVVSTCLVSGSAMAANCSIGQFYFQFGTDSSAHMQVKSGARCGANLNYRGGVQRDNQDDGSASIRMRVAAVPLPQEERSSTAGSGTAA